MRMVNALQTPKFRSHKSSEQAHILFAVLLISVLSTGLIFHYSYSLRNTSFRSHVIKATYSKKQAVALAHVAFAKLKSFADKDACGMYEKGNHFYFRDHDTIEQEFHNGHKLEIWAGYQVKGIWAPKLTFACHFTKQGLRKSLAEVMQSENLLEDVNSKEGWILAKERWKTLKRCEPLPPNIFPPLIMRVEIFEQETEKGQKKHIHILWENPYDRPLRGEVFNASWGAGSGCPLPEFSIQFDPTFPKYITEGCFQEHQYIVLKIKNGYDYTILNPRGTLSLKKDIGNREKGFDFDLVSGRKTARSRREWLSAAPGAVPEVNQPPNNSLKNLLPTKTWIDELDACFFEYEPKEIYSKIGNFKTRYATDLRDFFWNETIANPKADVFYFNGPKTHIEERLRAYGVSPDRVSNIAGEIVKHQPYTSAVDFLKKLAASQIPWLQIKNILHQFEFLSHRTEKFEIKSWFGEYSCKMIVQREAIDATQRTWRILSIHLQKKGVNVYLKETVK